MPGRVAHRGRLRAGLCSCGPRNGSAVGLAVADAPLSAPEDRARCGAPSPARGCPLSRWARRRVKLRHDRQAVRSRQVDRRRGGMKYEHSIERSAELLRRALPLMSRQGAPLHPVSYAVWYAYAADDPAALRQAVDAHLARHGTLDEAATQAIYRQYLADLDPDTAIRVADGVRRVLSGISNSAAAASEQTTQFGQSLDRS